MPVTPWTHDSPFVPGTTVRADSANFKFDGISACFEVIANRLNQRIIELPSTFAGNVTIPEKSVTNTLLYINSAGNMDVYPKAQFDLDVSNTAAMAGQVATNTSSAADSASKAYSYMMLAQQAAGVATGSMYFASTFDGLAFPPIPAPVDGTPLFMSTGDNPTLDLVAGDFVFYDHIGDVWRLIPGEKRVEEIGIYALGGVL